MSVTRTVREPPVTLCRNNSNVFTCATGALSLTQAQCCGDVCVGGGAFSVAEHCFLRWLAKLLLAVIFLLRWKKVVRRHRRDCWDRSDVWNAIRAILLLFKWWKPDYCLLQEATFKNKIILKPGTVATYFKVGTKNGTFFFFFSFWKETRMKAWANVRLHTWDASFSAKK